MFGILFTLNFHQFQFSRLKFGSVGDNTRFNLEEKVEVIIRRIYSHIIILQGCRKNLA